MKGYIPSQSISKDHGKKRGKNSLNYRTGKNKYDHWYNKRPEGTQEELEEAFKLTETYLYKLLDYAEKDEGFTKEELAEARRIFAFAKQGPKATYFVANPRSKLVSADVLYILTSTLPAPNIAEKYGIKVEKVKEIRRGASAPWIWEYLFVKRIKAIIRGQIARNKRSIIYSISKVISPDKTDILIYTNSLRKAKELRQSILTKKEYNELEKSNTLDIIYPINVIDILK